MFLCFSYFLLFMVKVNHYKIMKAIEKESIQKINHEQILQPTLNYSNNAKIETKEILII